jgi:hypothetical protein
MRLAEGRKIAATVFDIDDGGKDLSDVTHRRCRTEGTFGPSRSHEEGRLS